MRAKHLTPLVFASAVLAVIFGVAGWSFGVTAITITVGILAFGTASVLRKDSQTATRPLGLQIEYRALWVTAAASWGVATSEPTPILPIVGGIGVLLILAEPILVRRVSVFLSSAMNLELARDGALYRVWIRLLPLTSVVLPLTLLAFGKTRAPGWAAVSIMLVAASLLSAVALVTFARRFGAEIVESVQNSLEVYSPKFALYFSAPAGSEYQVAMWVPYLEAIEEPWVIIVREPRYLASLSELTNAPVIAAPSMRRLEEILVPSIRTVFYVNNGIKNGHCIRYADRTHVQLLHGDSDKPSSYNPVTAMYDRIFVAGQAGIDRYAKNGVSIDPGKFEIVGRPQVEGIEVSDGKRKLTTVLYAPTWQGFTSDANYSSLQYGEQVIRALLDSGMRVLFRPHPASIHDPSSKDVIQRIHEVLTQSNERGGEHSFGEAMADISIVDCFNQSDALVTDISAVPGDYLFSLKPFITVKVLEEFSDAEFLEHFPLARASYLWSPEGKKPFDEVFADILRADPLAPMRAEMRQYYLGPFPAKGYAANFVLAARREINGEGGPRVPHSIDRDSKGSQGQPVG